LGLIGQILVFFIEQLVALLMSIILSAINLLGNFMMEPFSFSTEMFSTMLTGDFLNTLENLMISAGISIATLLLIFGLLRVFTGRLNDDVPNPYALVGKYLLAIGGCYWIIPVTTEYLFPFAQYFFDEILHINFNLLQTSGQQLLDTLTDYDTSTPILDTGVFLSKTLASLFGGSTFILIFECIVFIIGIIAALTNVIKLVVENAERYFTINTLILAGPLAVACAVSEKSFQIFKSWFYAVISSIVTVIFNLIGFKMVILAFSNTFNTWASDLGITKSIISLIALIAISKMIQKFDQLISMIVFRINPIQNRSLLMSTLGTIGALDKSARGITGASLRQNLGLDGGRKSPLFRKVGDNTTVGNSPATNNSSAGKNAVDSFDPPGQANKPFGRHGKPRSDNLSNLLVGDNKKQFNDAGGYKTRNNGYNLYAGDAISALKAQNLQNGLGEQISPKQANAIISDINGSLDKNHKITGYDADRQQFKIGAANNTGTVRGDTIAAKINGDPRLAYVGTRNFKSERDMYDNVNKYCRDNNLKCTMWEGQTLSDGTYQLNDIYLSEESSAQHVLHQK